MTPSQLLFERKKRGEALMFTRKKLGLSKLALANKSGLSRPTINRIENGTGSWSIETEIIYVNALQINDVKQN